MTPEERANYVSTMMVADQPRYNASLIAAQIRKAVRDAHERAAQACVEVAMYSEGHAAGSKSAASKKHAKARADGASDCAAAIRHLAEIEPPAEGTDA